jgi:hypothetical protein
MLYGCQQSFYLSPGFPVHGLGFVEQGVVCKVLYQPVSLFYQGLEYHAERVYRDPGMRQDGADKSQQQGITSPPVYFYLWQ